jgi:hypothetical protein
MKNKKISFKGEVVGEPSIWVSQSGTPCCKFSVRCKDGIYECIAFHEKAEIQGLATGCQISIRGSYKDQEAFEGKSVTVDVAIVEGGAVTSKDALIAEYGSIENYRDELMKSWAYKKKLGMLQAKYTIQTKEGSFKNMVGWFHQDRCARHPVSGERWLAIDLCMNILGAQAVNKRLRDKGIAVIISDRNASKYRECLDEMLMEVMDVMTQEAPF